MQQETNSFLKKVGYWQIEIKDGNHHDGLDFEIAYLYYDGHWQLHRINRSKSFDPNDPNIKFLKFIVP